MGDNQTSSQLQPPARERPRPTIAIKVHLPEDLMELLRDVALAHVVDDVAGQSHDGTRTPPRNTSHSVDAVIVALLRRHQSELENEARTVRGTSRRPDKPDAAAQKGDPDKT